MNLYLFQVINGIGLGMIYFLISVGLSIIFGLLNFVNFAHGAFYLLGAYLSYTIVNVTGNYWLALMIAPFCIAFFAWVCERTLIKRVYHLPHMYQILVTLGVALIVQEVCIYIWGPIGKNIAPPDLLKGVIQIGDFYYPIYRVFVIAFASVVALLIWILLDKTKFGALVRAGSEDAETVSLLGTHTHRLFSITFALGVGLAGLAGVLAAPIKGIHPFVGPEVLGIAFVVVVIGGMG